ncbi:hypothetical protein [Phenylobacterium sp.]|uniref:hypothetical protein n=1 Tax=Phenylobacterium sp. TaxID=1871053 RepID=UPI002E32FAD1|nr:hypothetical protein [Phenylobacterium sp.]HEX3363580.1 hypothetical protein [Phenylobacterium sp.]
MSEAAAETFWPTMITDNRTSCRKVWAIQATRAAVPALMASGKLISASRAKA